MLIGLALGTHYQYGVPHRTLCLDLGTTSTKFSRTYQRSICNMSFLIQADWKVLLGEELECAVQKQASYAFAWVTTAMGVLKSRRTMNRMWDLGIERVV